MGNSSLQPKDRDNETADKDAPVIKKVEIDLPDPWKDRLAFVLHNVLSQKECEEYIRKTEEMGYEAALLNVGNGRQIKATDVRNNGRCMWDSVEEADKIFQRLRPYLPETWQGRKIMGLNERLRFLRYDPGEYFKPHMDGNYVRENGETSYVTVQMYLNQGFKGGSTTFMGDTPKENVECVPKTGSALIFQHNIIHEGSELKSGRKYSLRTDVMYAPA